MFSGGAGSFETAWRVIQRRGRTNVTLLFTDTLHEDSDLYRFLIEAAAFLTGKAGLGEVSGLAQLAAQTPPVEDDNPTVRAAYLARVRVLAAAVIPQLVWIADGRDLWQTFREERFLGNSSRGICTDRLKQKMADQWRVANCDPKTTRCYVGLDWSEPHRYEGESYETLVQKRERDRKGLRRRMLEAGWRYYAPMLRRPYLTKGDIFDHMRAVGIKPPRLYAEGFAHNNCGGGCVKAGQGHFALLLRARPQTFAYWEKKEGEMRDLLGDVSILTDRRGDNAKKPLPLATLRARIEAGQDVDLFDVGGCGCFIDTEAA